MDRRTPKRIGTILWLLFLIGFVGLNAAFMVGVGLADQVDAANRAIAVCLAIPLVAWTVSLIVGLRWAIRGPAIIRRRWSRFTARLEASGFRPATEGATTALLALPVPIFEASFLDPSRGGGIDHVMEGTIDGRRVRCCNVRVRGAAWFDVPCVAIEVPASCPRTRILPTRAAVVPLPGAEVWRSELERFNRRFWVMSEDRYFAGALLDARMVDMLLQADLFGLAFELADGWLVIWDGRPRGRRDPKPWLLLETAQRFAQQVPTVTGSLFPKG